MVQINELFIYLIFVHIIRVLHDSDNIMILIAGANEFG